MLRRDAHGDAHDAHLRNLLDQRSARSAMVYSDYDSPSVYSSPFFSPQPNDIHLDARSVDSHHSLRSPASPRTAPFEARSRLNELAQSMLDLDDDSRAPSDEDEDDDAPDTVDAEHEPDDPRLSMLGPKMRFHGKAPWEMNDALEEEDEVDPERTSNRGRDGFRKSLGFRSSSRGTTASSRPSGESTRSQQAKPKRSFETTSSANSPYSRGGALHALGQASLSSTSLVPQPTQRPGLRLNFPLSDSDPSSPYATPPRAPASPRSLASHSNAPSPIPRGNPEYAHFLSNSRPTLTRRGTGDSTASKSTYSEEMHPYANPDLVVSYADDPSPTPSRSAFNIPSVSRSDSTATVTESLPTTTSLSRSVTGSTLTPDTSASSMPPSVSQSPRSRVSLFHGKEISSPIPRHPSVSNISTSNISSPLIAPTLPPGWTERSASPTFALISLEEARAQRSRSATTQNPSALSMASAPFPEAPLPPDGHNHSPTNSVTSRARARSISTGARAKAALQNMVGSTPAKPERRDSEPTSVAAASGPSSKTLKHKKSGFMRLFNGARGEREERESPPPVPSLSDEHAAFNAQVQGGGRSTKGSIHRVPPPPVSPSMFQDARGIDDLSRISPSSSSSRPTPPPLSIKTGSHARLRAASTAEDFQTRTVPSDVSDRDWHHLDLPQSAPPNVTEFPALKLRPVSTLFSAHFGDHMVLPHDAESQPALDADADTLSSTSPISMTPITPGILPRHNSGDKDRLPMATISEDQSALVQTLQEQLTSSKKAWQRHIWELEGQVRDLKAEVESLRAAEGGEYCETCGRGKPTTAHDHRAFPSVVDRPRARTGTSARFGSAV